ncbi:S-layer homology domain-containing protein [Tissierella sp. Yu-01]|uniref:S-layer homology domain-containing protein n=1 Tax=Tissierella sp. Yu-01 TaxID=3035694 RepID=UPI00240E63D0|nr:S-layer homology domain-containing protein [Tissierella sp. Yu-01]WFA08561.1 S-layer homology domain-containing protein [Tissierella sp. Yu-01]
MNQKFLAIVLALVMILGTVNVATAATGNEKVDWLIEKGLVTGDSGGYRLNDRIKRSEVAAMVVRALGEEDIANTLKGIKSKFPDMNLSDVLWARGYVNYVASNNYVNGYPDGSFGPSRDITYAEVIKVLVMINGDAPELTGFDGSYWAIPYITKANEVGITEGVTIPNNDYKTPATREKVFELVYNTIMLLESAGQEVYKGIVTENSRVSKLEKNEIKLVVFSKGDNSPKATLRYDKDNEIKIKLTEEYDSEALLGKVVDIAIDKDNNAVKITIDHSYSYINGLMAAGEDEIRLENNDTYEVYLENRYPNSIDRVFGVYHNDQAFAYDDYVEKLDAYDGTGDGLFIPEHGRVTVKGNRTYFIDSFTFDDIAPVAEVEKSGEEVYVYDDLVSADLAEYNLETIINYTKDGYSTSVLKSIEAGDVIHVYDSNKAIVRQDAELSGKYGRILEAYDVYYAEIGGSRYQLRNSSYKRPVYSLDGSKYFTLMASDASEALNDLKGKDVGYFIDVNGHVQLIEGQLEYSEDTVIINNIGTRDIEVIDSTGSKKVYNVDNYSSLYIANSSTKRNLNEFDKGDVVYLFNDGNMVNTLIKMATTDNIDSSAVKVVKTSKGEFDISLSNSWIRLESGIYELNNTTNLYIVEKDGNKVSNIESVTLKGIAEKAKPGTDLKAYVISEKDFNNLNLGNKKKTGSSGVVAHTIIFTDFELDDSFLNVETIEMSFDYKTNSDVIIGKNTDGKEIKYQVKEFSKVPSLKAKDVVTLYINEDGDVLSADIRIQGTNRVYDVVDVDYVSSKIESITIVTDAGEEEKFVSRDLIIFGDKRVSVGDRIAFDVDEDGDIEVIAIY